MLLRLKGKIAVLLCAFLLLFVFSGCSLNIDSGESRQLCEEFLDHVINNDYDAAYGMISEACTEDEFLPLWNILRDTFKDSSSYELEQTGWNVNLSDGIKTTAITFEVKTDDDKICQIAIVTIDGINGIAGVNFLDSTEFAESTEFVPILNIVLICLSIGGFGFSVWMFVDCMKRRIKLKVLWAFIILMGFGVGLTFGSDDFGFNIQFSLLIALSSIVANRAALAVTVKIVLPVGAIIYCILRKKLTLPPPETVVQEPPIFPQNSNMPYPYVYQTLPTPGAMPPAYGVAPPTPGAVPPIPETQEQNCDKK